MRQSRAVLKLPRHRALVVCWRVGRTGTTAAQGAAGMTRQPRLAQRGKWDAAAGLVAEATAAAASWMRAATAPGCER
jgi:hypothetical protein